MGNGVGLNRRSVLWGSAATGGALIAESAAPKPVDPQGDPAGNQARGTSVLDLIPKHLHEGIRAGSVKEPVGQYLSKAFAAGETLYAPRGLYLIDATLPTAGVTLRGDGIGKTIFRNVDPSKGFDMMRCDNGSTDLSGFTLDNVSGDENRRGSGLVLSNSHESRVADISCVEQNMQGFAMRNGCTRNKLQGLRSYRCRHRGMNISESSNDNIIYDFHAVDCFKAGFLIGFASNRNIISKLRLFGAMGGCFWLHHGCERNSVSDVIAGATSSEGPPLRPLFRVEIACRDNDFEQILLTGARLRALQIVSGAIANDKVAAANNFQNSACERNRFRGLRIFGEAPENEDSLAILVSNSARNFGAIDNAFEDVYISGFARGVSYSRTTVLGTRFRNVSFGDVRRKKWDIPFRSDFLTRFDNADGLSFAGSLEKNDTEFRLAQPPLVDGKDAENPFGLPVMVVISGSVGGVPYINGASVGDPAPNDGNGSWIIGPGQRVRLSGGGPKARWKWFGLN